MQKVGVISNNISKPSEIVIAIKANDNSVLQSLYTLNYSKVEILVLKNNGTKDQAKDIYQEAFLTVWKNVKSDKFIPQNKDSLNGYLYTIAKNKWTDYLRSSTYKKEVKSDLVMTNLSISDVSIEEIEEDIIYDQKLEKAKQAFEKLGIDCKNLLLKFYFEHKSVAQIATELKLNEGSTRNKKYRCMQRLRAQVFPPNT